MANTWQLLPRKDGAVPASCRAACIVMQLALSLLIILSPSSFYCDAARHIKRIQLSVKRSARRPKVGPCRRGCPLDVRNAWGVSPATPVESLAFMQSHQKQKTPLADPPQVMWQVRQRRCWIRPFVGPYRLSRSKLCANMAWRGLA